MLRDVVLLAVLVGCGRAQKTAETAEPPKQSAPAAATVAAFSTDEPIVTIRHCCGGPGLPEQQGGIVIWQDGTIRFECPVVLGQPKHEPITHRGHLQPGRVQELLAALEHTHLFAPEMRDEQVVEGFDCGLTYLEARSGSRRARLEHRGCGTKPTTLYTSAVKVLSTFIDEAPCGLRCQVFELECDF